MTNLVYSIATRYATKVPKRYFNLHMNYRGIIGNHYALCIASRSYSIDHRPRGHILVKTCMQERIELEAVRCFGSVNDSSPEKKVEKKSLFKRFKEMYRDYWYVLIPVHLVTSAAWFGTFYYIASSGVDVPALLEAMNFSEKFVNSMRNSSMGYIAISYGLYKIFTPARYAVTLGGTTVSIQYLKKWGYIKPTKELKEMYQEKKQSMRETRENFMEKVYDFKDKKDSFMESMKETKKGISDKKDSIISNVKDAKEMVSKVVGSSKSEKS